MKTKIQKHESEFKIMLFYIIKIHTQEYTKIHFFLEALNEINKIKMELVVPICWLN